MEGRSESLDGLTRMTSTCGGLDSLLAALFASCQLGLVAEEIHRDEIKPSLLALEDGYLEQCRALSADYALHLQLGQDEVRARCQPR